MSTEPEKKAWRRGRKPGQPVSRKPGRKKNPNDRPGLSRFSVSLPTALGRMVRALKPQLDLEYSKIFRSGLDEVVQRSFEEGKISKKFYEEYREIRRSFRDEDWSG
jgi:hypothetical protein